MGVDGFRSFDTTYCSRIKRIASPRMFSLTERNLDILKRSFRFPSVQEYVSYRLTIFFSSQAWEESKAELIKMFGV